ncbi:MAG: hypothetical protein K8W52_30805 [Deltaproteobacteria bacterium]|nr:hypothetical protein [Deltaproteobacteria bacterium]
MRWSLAAVLLLAACGPAATGTPVDGAAGDAAVDSALPQPDGAVACDVPPTPAGADVELAPAFASAYAVYDLGPPPGVPSPLGGAVVKRGAPDTLLIAGASENANGAIYEIGVTRGACGHIIGWNGIATAVANTPYVDANLVYAPGGLLLYTEWPQFLIDQLPAGATAPTRTIDFTSIGMDATGDSGPGGLGLVPPGLAAAGELRTVTWPLGRWHHVTTAPDGGLLAMTAVTNTVTLPNNPGGFAYVPAGSPGFATQSIIVAEWVAADPAMDRVAVYDADAQGDPVLGTRREFLAKFPRPWGAYFEPETGDYLFLSWGNGAADRVYVVQGFVPPPIVN